MKSLQREIHRALKKVVRLRDRIDGLPHLEIGDIGGIVPPGVEERYPAITPHLTIAAEKAEKLDLTLGKLDQLLHQIQGELEEALDEAGYDGPVDW